MSGRTWRYLCIYTDTVIISRSPPGASLTRKIEAVVLGRLQILQPMHWLAEVAAVAARLTPQTAIRDVEMLAALEFPTTDDPNVMRRATALAIQTHHHLSDTLYHAVALENDAFLVTADDRFHTKAERYGSIASLRNWEPVTGTP
ncbi:MAG: type II toxin-antitoxin system VapC family toxin [Steroidobacteraceae bacterium]